MHRTAPTSVPAPVRRAPASPGTPGAAGSSRRASGTFGSSGKSRLIGGVLAGLLALVGVAGVEETPAHALNAYRAAGINWAPGQGGAGNFHLPNGQYVYCAELFIATDPSGSIPNYVASGIIPERSDGGITVYQTSGNTVKQIGYLISRYGQTNNDLQAAAVAYAVWAARDGNAAYQAKLAQISGSIGAAAVNLAHSYLAEALNWVSAGGGAGGNAWGASAVTATSPYAGLIQVPIGATQVTITNGQWSDGSTVKSWSAPGAPAGTTLTWAGIPPSSAGWDKYYRVSFGGNKFVPGTLQHGDGRGWQATVTTTPSRIDTLSNTYVDLDTAWAPTVVSTVTSKYIRVGDTFTDTITFGTLPEAPGRSQQWRWRHTSDHTAEWMPVTATGTVYGPYLNDPALNPNPAIPVGASVAATITYTTIHPDGSFLNYDPVGHTYPIDTGTPALAPGYYTFVWEILGDQQHSSVTGIDHCVAPRPHTGCSVFPASYHYSEGFGAANETQTVRMLPQYTTDLGTDAIAIGDWFTDTITIPARQAWLKGDTGARHTLTLTGTAYLDQHDTLLVQQSIPADATVLGTTHVTTDPAQNGQTLVSDPMLIPVTTPREAAHVTMVWCVLDAEQKPEAQGVREETCDRYGLPAESARIVWPEVSSQAQAVAKPGSAVGDVAIVTGPVPAGSTLTFELYQQPYPGAPKPISGLGDTYPGDTATDDTDTGTDGASMWTSDEIAALPGPTCTADTRVVTLSGSTPAAGMNRHSRYHSDTYTPPGAGTYWWVEVLTAEDPATGDPVVLHRGACGTAHETTRVLPPVIPVVRTPAPQTPTVLPVTGQPVSPSWGWASACTLIVIGALSYCLTRRRKPSGEASEPINNNG